MKSAERAPDRTDRVFLVALLTLASGVPTALFGLYFFADQLPTLAAGLSIALVLLAVFGIVAVRYSDRVLLAVTGRLSRTAQQLVQPLGDAAGHLAAGDATAARRDVTQFAHEIVARYAWVQTRRWMASSAVALLVAFAGLVGSALLKHQNMLIEVQNEFFREQVRQQQLQLEAQQKLANQSIRSEAIERIYGPTYAHNPRVKAEAVRSLVAVERTRISEGENTLPTDYVNLHDVDLARAWLDGADLERVSFRSGDLRQAVMNGADLRGASLRFVNLQRAALIGGVLEGAQVAFSNASEVLFSRANLSGALLSSSNLAGADFSDAIVSNASFVRCDLRKANLSDLQGWSTIESMEKTNIFGVRGAPPGFVEWALAHGAIHVDGAVPDIEKLRAEQLAAEERAE